MPATQTPSKALVNRQLLQHLLKCSKVGVPLPLQGTHSTEAKPWWKRPQLWLMPDGLFYVAGKPTNSCLMTIVGTEGHMDINNLNTHQQLRVFCNHFYLYVCSCSPILCNVTTHTLSWKTGTSSMSLEQPSLCSLCSSQSEYLCNWMWQLHRMFLAKQTWTHGIFTLWYVKVLQDTLVHVQRAHIHTKAMGFKYVNQLINSW